MTDPIAGWLYRCRPATRPSAGRPTATLRLSDTLVSRRHARIFLAPGSAEILDLGSANGLTLNDEPVVRALMAARGSAAGR